MVKLIKRSEISKRENVTIRILSILIALVASGIFLGAMGYNPLEVIFSLGKGAFGSAYRIRETIVKSIPLAITAVGIAVAFKMQFWNIGAEGQIFMGAFGAALIALKFSNTPKPILLLMMLLAAVAFAGLWALISAILKLMFNTNETIITLMLNYIALKFITYLQYGPWRDKKAMNFPKIPNFSDNAILPEIFKIHIGWIFALIVIVLLYIFMNHTKLGYEISVIGESENTARYAGINIKKVSLIAIFISGALCGLTGFIQASAVSQTLSVEVTGGIGYTAIIVAWLANLSAPVILIVSILFAALLEGGNFIQTAFGIPNSAALVIQALILFSVLGSELFLKYKLVFSKKLEEEVA